MKDSYKWKNKPAQIIICAAIKDNKTGHIFLGARHFDKIMRMQIEKSCIKPEPPYTEQGFIDQFGEFISREDALEIVKNNGQPFNAKNNGSSKALYSEGLY